MLYFDIYSLQKLQFNTWIGLLCSLLTFAIVCGYAAIEGQSLAQRFLESKSIIQIAMVDSKGVVQTDYAQYGSWVVQVISWTDPKTWFIADETPLTPCAATGAEGQFCYLNSRTIVGSDKDNSGTNVVLSFKPC